MDQYQRVNGDISFARFTWEHQVLLPTVQDDQLEDISLVVFGHPSSVGPIMGTSPSQVRFYWGNYQLTGSLLAVLRENLDGVDQADVLRQYDEGLDLWLETGDKLGADYPGGAAQLLIDREIKDQILRVSPLSRLLDTLGGSYPHSRGSGTTSNRHLHIFNYLFTFIKIGAVSLRAVLADHNASQGTSLDIASLIGEPVTFSFGPCRLFELAAWDPRNQPGGAVTFDFTLRYHNPNDDAIRDITRRVTTLERQLNTLAEQINNRLRDIRRELSPIGTIQRTQLEMTRKLNELAEGIAQHESHVVGQERELASLNAKADELRRLIESLG